MSSLVVVSSLAVVAYALVSRRLASTVLTAPLFFAAVGLIAGPVLGILHPDGERQVLVELLEAALVMVLFADASSLDVRKWTREAGLAGRLLGVGLPLTMILGTVLALLVFAGIEPWQAALIGVILAPTDAALGQAVVANPRVPSVIRNALNVESGLNDGLALPFVTILVTVGLVAAGVDTELAAARTLLLALVGSTVVGAAAGIGGGWLVRWSAERDLGEERWGGIALAALAAGTWGIADHVGASGFLAVWVAGLAAGTMLRGRGRSEAFHVPEQLADLLAGLGFLVVGVVLVVPVLQQAGPMTLVYAVLSLTVARMLPVALVMTRTGFAPASIAYVGWFGPRGLASIVFAGVVVEASVPDAAPITEVVLVTVLLSMILHGVTAAWGARRYAAWAEQAAARDPGIPEAAAPALAIDHRRSRSG